MRRMLFIGALVLGACANRPAPPPPRPVPTSATGRFAQAVHDCTATGANDCLLIAVGTADFRDAIAECVAISGNPAMEFPCLKMLVEAVTWTPPPPPQPPQRIIVQPARTPRPYVVLPGTVTMPIQRGAMPGTYYVQTPNGPRWFSVKPLP